VNEPGSQVYPSPQAIHSLIAGGMRRIREAIDSRASLAERHNAYTDHCLALLFCGTGHRPVVDPFQSLAQFDLAKGLLLISDKVGLEERAWRLVALPAMAAKQVGGYLDYLPKLAAWLAQEPMARSLAGEVRQLASGASSLLPLFFYMEREPGVWRHVTPGEMAHGWAAHWALPVNFLRHVTATDLLRKSQRADWAQIQLGHIDGVDHPLGATATQGAISTLSEIGRHMDAILEERGWRYVGSPLRMPGSGHIPKQQGPPIKPRMLGHERRARARARRCQRVAGLVRDVMGKMIQSRPLTSLSPGEFRGLLEGIVTQAEQQQVSPNHCLRLFYRFVARMKGGADLMRRVSRIRHIGPEPSPFSAGSLEAYRRLTEVRERFLAYLDGKGRKQDRPTKDTRIAEIVISAALFGAVGNKDRLRKLGEALKGKVYRLEDRVFVDIPLTDATLAPIFRWFPDPVSAGLIIGLHHPLIASGDGPKSLNARLTQVMAQMQQRSASPLAELAHLACTGLAFEMPGYVSAVLRGDIPAISLPLPQFARVVTDRALVATPVHHGRQADFGEWAWAPEIRCAAKTRHSGESARFRDTLRKTLAACWDVPATGNMRPRTRRKRQLASALQREFSHPGEWSSLPLLIVAWASHLCHRGTRFMGDLAYSTITKYLPMVTRPLLKLIGNQDFLSLSDVSYEEVYLRALEFEPPHRRARLAGRLREFHHFLAERYEIDAPDWSAVMAAAGAVRATTFASANIVTMAEYRQALACIRDDSSLPERTRTQYAALLFFGYRFGLRFGEAWRLQYRDVQYDGTNDEVYVLVRDNVFGEVKTAAGVRVIPLLEELSRPESDTLREIMGIARDCFGEDALIPLMAEYGNARSLIDRDTAVNHLHAVLRGITGDSSIRFHHLRHGWATRMVGQQHFAGEGGVSRLTGGFLPTGISRRNMERFIGTGPVAYPLRSIATAIGHAGEATTLASYVHCVDQIAGHICKTLSPALSDHAAAYCLGTAHATIRRRRSRRAAGSCHDLTSNKRSAGFISEPPVETAARSASCPGLNEGDAGRSLRLVEIDILLRRYGETMGGIRPLARRMLVDPDIAEGMLRAAIEIERDSGLTRYALESRIDDPIVRSGRSSRGHKKLFKLENRRVTTLLELLEKRLRDLDQDERDALDVGARVWRRTFRPATSSNLVTDLNELKTLLRAFAVLQLDAAPVLRVDSNARGNSELVGEISGIGYPVETAAIPYASEKSGTRRRGRIEVRFDTMGKTVGTARTFHRVIFIAAVALATDQPGRADGTGENY